MKEIITIQLGPFSNYVGTAFWNCFPPPPQAVTASSDFMPAMPSVVVYAGDSKRLFDSRRKPRVVALDFFENRSELESEYICEDSVADESVIVLRRGEMPIPPPSSKTEQDTAKDDAPETSHAEAPTPKIQSQPSVDLDRHSTPRHYLHTAMHRPPSIDADAFFSNFFLGREWSANSGLPNSQSMFTSTMEETWDSLRHQLEEADAVQCIQVLLDWRTAWGGIGMTALEFAREEAPKSGLAVFGTSRFRHSNSRREAVEEAMGSAAFVAACATELKGLSCAVALTSSDDLEIFDVESGRARPSPLISWDPSLDRDNAATLACAWDMITTPYRLDQEYRGVLARDLFGTYIPAHSPFIGVGISIPVPMRNLALKSVMAAFPRPPLLDDGRTDRGLVEDLGDRRSTDMEAFMQWGKRHAPGLWDISGGVDLGIERLRHGHQWACGRGLDIPCLPLMAKLMPHEDWRCCYTNNEKWELSDASNFPSAILGDAVGHDGYLVDSRGHHQPIKELTGMAVAHSCAPLDDEYSYGKGGRNRLFMQIEALASRGRRGPVGARYLAASEVQSDDFDDVLDCMREVTFGSSSADEDYE